MEQLTTRFPNIEEAVIRHVYENVCFGNEEIAIEALRSLSISQIEEMKINLAKDSSQQSNSTSLTSIEQEKVKQFKGVASCDDRVAVDFLRKHDWVLDYAINRFFEGGVSLDQINETEEPDVHITTPEEEKEEKKKPLLMNVEGLYDLTNREYLTLESVEYDIKMTDYAVEKTCSQKYKNTKENPIEIVYMFPILHEKTAIYSVQVDVVDSSGKKTSHFAQIKDRFTSQEEYDDKISQKNIVALMEKHDKHQELVQLNLGNINTKYEVHVIIKSVEEVDIVDYDETLLVEDDEEEEEGEEDEDEDEEDTQGSREEPKMVMRFRIPSIFPITQTDRENDDSEEIEPTVQSAMAIRNTTIRCDIDLMGGQIINTFSPGFSVKKHNLGPSRWIVTTKRAIAMTSDFCLDVAVKSFPAASCLVQKIPHGLIENVEACGMVSFIPRNEILPSDDHKVYSEFIIVVDCSGSMSGSRIKFAREAMRCFVQSLDPEEKVKLNIIRFGTMYKSMWTEPCELTESNFHEVMDFINDTDSNMAQTDILTPLMKVLKTKVTEKYSRQVFLLTDGEDKNCLKITQRVRREARSTRIFSLGIGSEINVFLIKETSRASNGKYGFLKDSHLIRKKVMEQLVYAFQPAVSNLSVDWPGQISNGNPEKRSEEVDQSVFGKVSSVISTEHTPWVYLNERLILYFYLERFPSTELSGEDSTISISFQFGENEEERDRMIRIPIRTFSDTDSRLPPLLLGRLSSLKRINEIQKYGKNKEEDVTEIRTLGLSFSLLTSQTSFTLALKPNESNPEEEEEENESKEKKSLKLIGVPSIPYCEEVKEQRIERPPPIKILPRNNPHAIIQDYMGGPIGASINQLNLSRPRSADDISTEGGHRYGVSGKGLGIGRGFQKAVEVVEKAEDTKEKMSFQHVCIIQDMERKREENRRKRAAAVDITGINHIVPSKEMQGSLPAFQHVYRNGLPSRQIPRHELNLNPEGEVSRAQEANRKVYDINSNGIRLSSTSGKSAMKSIWATDAEMRPWEDIQNIQNIQNGQNQHEIQEGDDYRHVPMEVEYEKPSDIVKRTAGKDDKGNSGGGDCEEEVEGEVEDEDGLEDLPALEEVEDLGINRLYDYDADDEEYDYDSMLYEERGRPGFMEHRLGVHTRNRNYYRRRKRRRGPDVGGLSKRQGIGPRRRERHRQAAEKLKKKEKEKTIKERIESIEGGVLNKILYTQQLNGLWFFDEMFIAELLQMPVDLVVEMNPISFGEEEEHRREAIAFWVSALTLVVLKRFHKNSTLIWKMIAKKSERLLKKRINFSDVLGKAESFVRKNRKR